jgi:hypothetical protein
LNKIKDKNEAWMFLVEYAKYKYDVLGLHKVAEYSIATPHEEEGNQNNEANIVDFGHIGYSHAL